jgi:LPS-assembly protein
MTTSRLFAVAVIIGCVASRSAAAQTGPGFTLESASQERLGENHLKLVGNVVLEQKDMRLDADEVEFFSDQDRAIATGNVVFTQGTNRIAADRADFNVKTRLGTFYGASGIANIQPPRRPITPGAFAPPSLTSSADTDVYFFGEVVEKIGPRRYRITNGGFSTCVQPTPRWNLHADTVVLNIDHYTVLRNAIFNVKGVPLLYVPVLYYPTNEEDRATGILLPTYGFSSLRGQAIHNAFFWAINRSQDATFMHEWYSKAGQGVGSEYRYNMGGGTDGVFAAHLLNQTQSLSTGGSIPATRAYEVRGIANQTLPGRLRLRARADYFSSVQVNQSFNTNVYDASRSSRTYGANVVGAWRTVSLNGTFDRSEYFYNTTQSGVQGNSPRVTLARNERPLFANAPIYVSANTEVAHLDRYNTDHGAPINDTSLGRFDVSPQVRYPFKRWQWLTVNSSLSWRDTFYTRSYLVAPNGAKTVVDEDLNRKYFTMQAQLIGPVFTRIFNTPDNSYAERFKHTIEPFLNVQRTTPIDNFDRIVVIDSYDSIVGNTTNYTYGINNRFYAKRRTVEGRPSAAQEVLSVELVQTYYTSPLASQYDTRYQTSFGAAEASNFSPISLSVRATPTYSLDATARAELDSRYRELRTLSANTRYSWTGRVQTQLTWTKRFNIDELSGFNDPNLLNHDLSIATNAHTLDNRYGLNYAVNYDILHSGVLQQRISAFYNAQCCGLAMEYQTYNYVGLYGTTPSDHRFFLSFTLAGLGNFSPFNGALSGVPR